MSHEKPNELTIYLCKIMFKRCNILPARANFILSSKRKVENAPRNQNKNYRVNISLLMTVI